ncbi:MAG TPA: type I-E CRISPR-associated protein Cas7/Cse4/CasC [Symbiobacteriaceae bacterium]|jgi:CRISPR system Cascade subunit CasC
MFLEIHLLQNFALSNLNRDDTGAPKTCTFGGTRRARISSQCLKRAIRTHFREEGMVPSELLSFRTKWLLKELTTRLVSKGLDQEPAGQAAAKALELLEFNLKKGKTEYLLMLGDREISHLAALCQEHAETLVANEGAKKGKKEADGQLAQRFLEAIDGGEALDIALFGRMIATHAEKNVDAAVQMAHAFSTHAVATEFDFYSAVDDLRQYADDEGAGAGMLGTTLYNSSCYYRYANLDINQLRENFNGKVDHMQLAVRSFLNGAINAVPTGKQTNSAPQNPPALVMIVLREKGLWSLANAFVRPVFSGVKGDLVQLSAVQLLHHWNELAGLYGTEGISYAGVATYISDLPVGKTEGLVLEAKVPTLLDRVMQAVSAAN